MIWTVHVKVKAVIFFEAITIIFQNLYERKLFFHYSDFIIICKQRFRGKILLYWFNEQLSVQNPWLINQLMSPESVSLLLKFMWIKSYSMLSICYHLKSSSKVSSVLILKVIGSPQSTTTQLTLHDLNVFECTS